MDRSKNEYCFSCVMMSSSTFFGTLLTLWLLGDLSSVRCCEFAANLFVNSQDDEWFANNRTRVYNAAWPLKKIGNRLGFLNFMSK